MFLPLYGSWYLFLSSFISLPLLCTFINYIHPLAISYSHLVHPEYSQPTLYPVSTPINYPLLPISTYTWIHYFFFSDTQSLTKVVCLAVGFELCCGPGGIRLCSPALSPHSHQHLWSFVILMVAILVIGR